MGITALHRCAYGAASPESAAATAALLVNAGADANVLADRADGFEESVAAAHIAAARGNVPFLQVVFSNGKTGGPHPPGTVEEAGAPTRKHRGRSDASYESTRMGPGAARDPSVSPPSLPAKPGAGASVAAQSMALLGGGSAAAIGGSGSSTPVGIHRADTMPSISIGPSTTPRSTLAGAASGRSSSSRKSKSKTKKKRGAGAGGTRAKTKRSKMPDINVRTHRRWTPLHYAANAGHEECCVVLAQLGAQLDARASSPEHCMPADLARQKHHSAVEAYLEERLGAHGRSLHQAHQRVAALRRHLDK